jgi:predicted GH43/DUF377 family glycosyl hydrolase
MQGPSKSFFSLRIPKSTFYLFIILLVCVFLFLNVYKKEVKKGRKMRKLHKKYVMMLESRDTTLNPIVGGGGISKLLQNVPYADKQGIVLASKIIPIRNVEAPYNASIIEHGDGYQLFFRYDKIVSGFNCPFHTFIGCCDLDKNFNQTSKEFSTLDTKSFYSEDPRVVNVNNKRYLIFNDLIVKEDKKLFSIPSIFKDDVYIAPRTMHIAEIDNNLNLKFITNLDIQLEKTEKNWVPFEYTDKKFGTDIYFEYKRNPHKILKLKDPTKNHLSHMNYTKGPPFQDLYWPKKWGSVRGGTPAKKIGNEYLAFFHSGFKDGDGFVWYVMGAYTFEEKPPFRITGISKYPIFFDGIYSSPHLNTANPELRCIYPAGFVPGTEDGRDVFYVSCGENDSAIKILTIDKETLLKSLKKL